MSHIDIIYNTYPFLKERENSSITNYVYKSCKKNWIIVMLPCKDTITNENRNNICDKNKAKYRASHLLVVMIFNKLDPSKIIYSIETKFSSNKISTSYEVGKNVYPDKFDDNLDNICSSGIHYFKSLERAFYYEIPDDYQGKYIIWYDNGNKREETFIIINNNKLIFNGIYKKWYENGNLEEIGNYEMDELDGECICYYNNGNKKISATFYHGLREGPETKWYENGNIMEHGLNVNDEKIGIWIYYKPNGLDKIEINESNNKL